MHEIVRVRMGSLDFSSRKMKGITIIGLAFTVRLFYIFYVVPIDWVGDSYHHWQIAIYTLKIGILRGRMWDLKGLEYYWPPLPTLIEALLLRLTGSTSIMIMRLLNSLVGSISVYLAYLIGGKVRGGGGVTAMVTLLFFPLTLNTEVLALHEPLMGLFFLAGLLLFLRERRFYAGVLFGFSYLCHFSVYLSVPILVVAILLKERQFEMAIPFFSGFCVVYLPYAFILRLHTGDLLYNIRSMLTYMGISTAQMRHPLANIFGLVLGTLGVILIISARKKRMLSLESLLVQVLLGCYMLFWGALFSIVGVPLSPYEMRYYWIPLILSIIYLSTSLERFKQYHMQNIIGFPRSSFFYGVISLLLLVMFSPTFFKLQNPILFDFDAADRMSEFYYNGTIISPVPDMTYRLINDWDVSPQSILGPIYCPIEQTAKIRWLKENNVTILFWLPDMEADRVFPELSDGVDVPPFFLLERLGYDRYIYAHMQEKGDS